MSWRTRTALLRPGRVPRAALRDAPVEDDDARGARFVVDGVDSGGLQIAQFWMKRL